MIYERLDTREQITELQRARDARKRAAHLMRKYGTADPTTIQAIREATGENRADAVELHAMFPCLDLKGWRPKRIIGGTR